MSSAVFNMEQKSDKS